MEFQHESGHIYAKDPSGAILAEVTFPASSGVADINRTFVDPSLRGQGIADKLLSAAVEQIRSDGLKARLTCSCAVKWFEKHPRKLRFALSCSLTGELLFVD